jgi:geranylgeranylglycerol-phosphate geranylgeranyltransferase
VHPVLRLVRTGNTLVSFLGVVVGGLVARGQGVSVPLDVWATVLLAGASAAMVTAGGNVLNDVGDREGDRVNHPDRPLVTGAVSLAGARRLWIALFVGAAIAAAPIVLIAPWVAVILAAAIAALLLYEFRWKALGLAGNLLVAFLTAMVFLYGGAAVGAPVLLVPFALMAFGATLSREVIKDMEDAAGDVDRKTLPRTHGFGTATLVARGAVGLALVLSPVPLLSFVSPGSSAGIIYLASVLAADALFVVSVASLPRDLHRAQSVSKGAMTVALVAFLAAAFR